MGNDGLAIFQFEGYTIEEIKLLRKEKSTSDDAKMKFNLSIGESPDLNSYRLIIEVIVENPDVNVNVTMSGAFKFEENNEIPKEDKFVLLKSNGFAILLPYLRSVVSIITTLDGPAAVVLPIINVFEMMKNSDDKESDNPQIDNDRNEIEQ